ncbi:MAG: hypothetical protein ACO1NX_04065 [Chitinophagaceae bacterium]
MFGYLTATISSFFIGRDAEEKAAPLAGAHEMAALQQQLAALTQSINELKAEKREQ